MALFWFHKHVGATDTVVMVLKTVKTQHVRWNFVLLCEIAICCYALPVCSLHILSMGSSYVMSGRSGLVVQDI